MIRRSIVRYSFQRGRQIHHIYSAGVKHCRYSTSTTSAATSHASSSASGLGIFTNELDRIAPKFEISGSQVLILKTPSEFYETLKTKILHAEREIFLSTLYIGKTEHELIATIQKALRTKPKLKLSILTDALRGTRESPDASCASLLAPLVEEFGPDRVEVRMYHTPNLTGLRKKYIPKRINEGWGLQHMKLYGVDDEIILSGANLSADYFTNRQDRYHLISSKDITTYYFSIQKVISKLSFLVTPDRQSPDGYVLEWPDSNYAPSPLQDLATFISRSTSILHGIVKPKPIKEPSLSGSNINTVVYPISQLTPLLKPDTSSEAPAISTILTILSSPAFKNSSWTFTAGYFNPAPSLTRLLLSTSSNSNIVITASPEANGFYGSKGVSGLLPPAYTLLARQFLDTIKRQNRLGDITLKEWRRGVVGQEDGWTYHAKGLWVSLDGEKEPSLSIVGSSNYTKRSYSLDLETGAVIVTADKHLKKSLMEEKDRLQDYARVVGTDEFIKTERRVGIHVRIAMWLVKILGGAL
ncbi:hypothetical protein F5884DRAFT_768578 [Xylogone sp. PMI_703]|nr:hypothetical protein F5884DRAFT_768578 [Xylogone sp. PMI_703]